MFVNHIIKTSNCFSHPCLTIYTEPFPVLSAVTTSLLVCAVKLFIWYVAVYYLQYNICIRMIPWFRTKIWKVKHMTERNMDLPMCVSAWCTCLWEVRLWTVSYGMRIQYETVHNLTSYRQVHQALTHTDNIQPHTK